MFATLMGKTVNATITATQAAQRFMATPEGKLAKVAVAGLYVGYVLGAVVQKVTEEV